MQQVKIEDLKAEVFEDVEKFLPLIEALWDEDAPEPVIELIGRWDGALQELVEALVPGPLSWGSAVVAELVRRALVKEEPKSWQARVRAFQENYRREMQRLTSSS